MLGDQRNEPPMLRLVSARCVAAANPPSPNASWRPFDGPYEVQAFPWSGLAPCARASASDM